MHILNRKSENIVQIWWRIQIQIIHNMDLMLCSSPQLLLKPYIIWMFAIGKYRVIHGTLDFGIPAFLVEICNFGIKTFFENPILVFSYSLCSLYFFLILASNTAKNIIAYFYLHIMEVCKSPLWHGSPSIIWKTFWKYTVLKIYTWHSNSLLQHCRIWNYLMAYWKLLISKSLISRKILDSFRILSTYWYHS